MDTTTDPEGIQSSRPSAEINAASPPPQVMSRPHPLKASCFVIGVILLSTASVLVHGHPRPYPFDLETTLTVQHLHPYLWVNAFIEFVSSLNNPTPTIAALGLWLVGLIVIGLVRRFRGKPSLVWFQSAAGIVGTVAIASGINLIINTLVARPRPLPTDCLTSNDCVHVLSTIPVHSFPSGHTETDVAYYGFLLYLSFTPPVRQWRYHNYLIPFQIFAALDILLIGYSRILEGEHWLTDVLAGYLSGALWLALCIFLYGWIITWVEQRQAQGPVPTK
ncbi:MAG TPA: phosphatase PAP2 family protein [Ktedonobacteraceae bacterium]|nr:phosphatase PAP2 family protein [Ktedonobacteraceae bacterium]